MGDEASLHGWSLTVEVGLVRPILNPQKNSAFSGSAAALIADASPAISEMSMRATWRGTP